MPARTRHPAVLVFLLLTLMIPGHSRAQVFPRGNSISLADVTDFDLYVRIGNWAGMPGDPSEFRFNTQQLFEKKLVSAGISRKAANRNHLVCEVQATMTDDRVSYTTTLEYWLRNSTGVHTLLWKNGSIATTTRDQFNTEFLATECANHFVDEWSRWNPQ